MSINTIIFGISLIVLLIGIAFLTLGKYLKNNYKKTIKECTVQTDAEVTDVIKIDSGIDYEGYSWHTTIKYKVGNKTIEKSDDFGSTKQLYKKGQIIKIFYNPDNVEEFYIVGNEEKNKIGRVFTIAGVLIISFDIIALLITKLLICSNI